MTFKGISRVFKKVQSSERRESRFCLETKGIETLGLVSVANNIWDLVLSRSHPERK